MQSVEHLMAYHRGEPQYHPPLTNLNFMYCASCAAKNVGSLICLSCQNNILAISELHSQNRRLQLELEEQKKINSGFCIIVADTLCADPEFVDALQGVS